MVRVWPNLATPVRWRGARASSGARRLRGRRRPAAHGCPRGPPQSGRAALLNGCAEARRAKGCAARARAHTPLLTSFISVICSLDPLDHTTRHFFTADGRFSSLSICTSNRNLRAVLPPVLWARPLESLASMLPDRSGPCRSYHRDYVPCPAPSRQPHPEGSQGLGPSVLQRNLRAAVSELSGRMKLDQMKRNYDLLANTRRLERLGSHSVFFARCACRSRCSCCLAVHHTLRLHASP